jgi:hypothetical protein
MNIYAFSYELNINILEFMLMKYLMIRNGYDMHAYIDD